MYNPKPSPSQNLASLATVPTGGSPQPTVASSSAALNRKNSRATSSGPFWVWLIVFGGLYILYEWLWDKKLGKQDLKLHFMMRFVINMFGLFAGVVFAVNLGKIVVGKLTVWTQGIPMLNDLMHYIAVAVGNA